MSVDAVKQVDGYYDRLSVMKEVTVSTTLAIFLGEAIANDDRGVTIKSDGLLHYSVDGTAAVATDAQLPTVYSVHGKQQLEKVRLYSAVAQDVSIILFATRGN